ncbi:MAG: hypothetical protein IKN55_07590, partial [Oscillospiraceae bacterium]|nr:hypothetical protein [Oscillospiraceae bacterium]
MFRYRMYAAMTALAMLLTMTACSGSRQGETKPAEPAGATLTVPLSHSCKAVPLTEDADFRYGTYRACGDKIILTAYPEGYTMLGLYDTVTGTLVKTRLDANTGQGYTTFDGFDWRDGRLTALVHRWKEGESGITQREFQVFDENLNRIDTRPVTMELDAMESVLSWRVLSDGTQAVLTTDGFYLYDKQNGRRQVSDDSLGSIVLSPDETVWLIPNNGKPKRLDRDTLTLEPLQMDDLPRAGDNNGGYYDGFGDYALLCTDQKALYGLKPGAGGKEELVNFTDSDLVDASGFAPLPDGRLFCQTYDYLAFHPAPLLLTPRTQEEMDSIRTVTLASLYFDQETQSRIARFNRQADGCRLVLKSYIDMSDPTQDYNACMQAYQNDLLAGNVPDIMLIGQDYQMLSNKGLFEDMRPWMEQDPDFHEEDYMMNVLEAFSYKGHLERIPWKFYVSTNFAKTEFVGDRANLSASDLFALDLPEDMCYFYSGLGKSEACRDLLIGAAGNFVDYENGSCSFDSEEFVRILELADTIPAGKLPEGAYCYQENKVLLAPTSLWSLSSFHAEHEVMFRNADITLCGIGCDGGAVELANGIAVSA